MQQAELTVDLRNAQQLLVAGKSDEALTAFEAIKSEQPDFPGLADGIAKAQALKDVEVQYTQAMNLLQAGDSAQALVILQEISQANSQLSGCIATDQELAIPNRTERRHAAS